MLNTTKYQKIVHIYHGTNIVQVLNYLGELIDLYANNHVTVTRKE